MKKLLIFSCASLLAFAFAAPAFAADSPWNGTWKLNPAKSKQTGTTVTISANPDGTMHYTNGSTVQYNFACDGKDYPTLADRTFGCKKVSDSVYDTVAKRDNGTTLSTSHREISADGKSMTITTKGTQPDGTDFTATTKLIRTAGSSGMVGTWKSVQTSNSTPVTMVLSVNGDMIHSANPGQKSTVDAKLDGTPAQMVGPVLPPGLTMSFKSEGTHKLHVLEKINGKPLFEADRTLSTDGKTITEVGWSPGKPAEKQTLVYEKQ